MIDNNRYRSYGDCANADVFGFRSLNGI